MFTEKNWYLWRFLRKCVDCRDSLFVFSIRFYATLHSLFFFGRFSAQCTWLSYGSSIVHVKHMINFLTVRWLQDSCFLLRDVIVLLSSDTYFKWFTLLKFSKPAVPFTGVTQLRRPPNTLLFFLCGSQISYFKNKNYTGQHSQQK